MKIEQYIYGFLPIYLLCILIEDLFQLRIITGMNFFMTLQGITIIIGVIALIIGGMGVFASDILKQKIKEFPRSSVPAWIFLALCCLLGAREALQMNMGFLNEYKKAIYIISPAVFVASVIYMKELLAPRALGGFLLLIAVPILRIASQSGVPYFQIISTIVYIWILYGLLLLMSPWYFRKINKPLLDSPTLFKIAMVGKMIVGLLLIGLGIFVY